MSLVGLYRRILTLVTCTDRTALGLYSQPQSRFSQTDVLPGGGGGYSQKIWVGVCSPLPKTLTLFMTKICNFPYPIYDLTKNLIPYL